MAMSRVAVDGGTTWDMPCCSRMILKVLPPPNWSARSRAATTAWPITIHVGNVFLRNPTASRAASNSAVSSDVRLRLSGSLKLLWVCQKFLFQGLEKLSSARG
jgi:hypothetical protein